MPGTAQRPHHCHRSVGFLCGTAGRPVALFIAQTRCILRDMCNTTLNAEGFAHCRPGLDARTLLWVNQNRLSETILLYVTRGPLQCGLYGRHAVSGHSRMPPPVRTRTLPIAPFVSLLVQMRTSRPSPLHVRGRQNQPLLPQAQEPGRGRHQDKALRGDTSNK